MKLTDFVFLSHLSLFIVFTFHFPHLLWCLCVWCCYVLDCACIYVSVKTNSERPNEWKWKHKRIVYVQRSWDDTREAKKSKQRVKKGIIEHELMWWVGIRWNFRFRSCTVLFSHRHLFFHILSLSSPYCPRLFLLFHYLLYFIHTFSTLYCTGLLCIVFRLSIQFPFEYNQHSVTSNTTLTDWKWVILTS